VHDRERRPLSPGRLELAQPRRSGDLIRMTPHMRGPVTVRVQARDPKEGLVHVARWDFVVAP
jgi:hypothetical protein